MYMNVSLSLCKTKAIQCSQWAQTCGVTWSLQACQWHSDQVIKSEAKTGDCWFSLLHFWKHLELQFYVIQRIDSLKIPVNVSSQTIAFCCSKLMWFEELKNMIFMLQDSGAQNRSSYSRLTLFFEAVNLYRILFELFLSLCPSLFSFSSHLSSITADL